MLYPIDNCSTWLVLPRPRTCSRWFNRNSSLRFSWRHVPAQFNLRKSIQVRAISCNNWKWFDFPYALQFFHPYFVTIRTLCLGRERQVWSIVSVDSCGRTLTMYLVHCTNTDEGPNLRLPLRNLKIFFGFKIIGKNIFVDISIPIESSGSPHYLSVKTWMQSKLLYKHLIGSILAFVFSYNCFIDNLLDNLRINSVEILVLFNPYSAGMIISISENSSVTRCWECNELAQISNFGNVVIAGASRTTCREGYCKYLRPVVHFRVENSNY